MKVFTIGFTKTTAEHFFSRLKESEVQRLVDVRLNNVSQLAGFAKKSDLQFFLKSLCNIPYEHKPELAPTGEILDEYKGEHGSWSVYEKKFTDLMKTRRIEEVLPRGLLNNACLLCSEDKPHHCHRRLVVEYLREKWGNMEIVHL